MALRHDISQYYYLKETLEELFGRTAWIELKECTDLRRWRKYLSKALDVVLVAARATVRVADSEWFELLEAEIANSKDRLREATSIDEALSIFSAAQIRLSFIQLGHFPMRRIWPKVTLAKRNWVLSASRSVQYVQDQSQKGAPKRFARKTCDGESV